MIENTLKAEIIAMEDRLREAMLTSDVERLNELINDALIFIGPDGQVYRKEDDVEMHRTKSSSFSRIERMKMTMSSHPQTVIVTVDAKLAGAFKGEDFESTVRYLRVWQRKGHTWQVIAGSVAALP
jgi:ketosteroid isomerase-like protein